jgi:hypothetical protein
MVSTNYYLHFDTKFTWYESFNIFVFVKNLILYQKISPFGGIKPQIHKNKVIRRGNYFAGTLGQKRYVFRVVTYKGIFGKAVIYAD